MINVLKEKHTLDKIISKITTNKIISYNFGTFLNKDCALVETKGKKYLINIITLKEKGKNYLNELTVSLACLNYFDCNGVHALFPIKIDDTYFIKYHSKVYIVYGYIESTEYSLNNINDKIMKKIASTQAIINKLELKKELSTNYREVKQVINKKIMKLAEYSPKGYEILYKDLYTIEEIIDKYNKELKYIKNNLIVGYDNYNLENIEWLENYMYLVDLDNIKLINPLVSLAESAFYMSYQNLSINYENYGKYIEYYQKRFGTLPGDYKSALYISQNKDLTKLEKIINQSIKNKIDYSEEIITLIDKIIYYNTNIEKMYNTYIDIVKKQ